MSNLKKFLVDRSPITRLSEIHGEITPAETRFGEKISVKIFFDQYPNLAPAQCRVWRLSPLGVEVVWQDQFQVLAVGQKYRAEIIVGNHVSELEASVVAKKYLDSKIELLGLRFCQAASKPWDGHERREKKRWICSSEYLPTGVAPNPGKFNDFIFFRVTDVSATGVRIVSSLRNKFLLPGMTLESTLSFPLVGQSYCTLKILNVGMKREDGKSALDLGCQLIGVDNNISDLIGQYLFQFGPAISPEELRNQGFKTSNISKNIDYRYVRTAEEYKQVLELRLKAYGAAGKLKNSDDLAAVADEYDSRSRIVICLHKGRVIASTRLIYNEIDDAMEHEQYVEFPAEFPRKDEICEITRVCTDPEYRRTDLLLGLFRFVGLTVVQSKRRYILGCATDDLLPLYAKLGFSITNISYQHKQLNDLKHTVFIGDVVKGISGHNVNPIYWNIIWADLFEHLRSYDYINIDPLTLIRTWIYRLLRPLSLLLYKKMGRKKRKQK